MIGKLRTGALLGVCAALTALVLGGYVAGALDELERSSVDARFLVRATHAPPRDIAVVGIDDVTFSDFGKIAFPFPRKEHAAVIRRLTRDGAKEIAYDVQFTEPSADPKQDEELVEAVAGAPRAVLATTEADARGRTRIFGGDDVLKDIGARAGTSILPLDPGGSIRRPADTSSHLRAFALVAAERTTGRPIGRVPAHAYIDYRGAPGTVRTYSFSRVRDGRIPAAAFRGKLVVVGATAPSLQDVHPTPVSGDTLMSGPEIQANAISTALRGFPLRGTGRGIDVGLIVLLGLLPGLAGARLSALRALALSVAAGLALTVAGQLAFDGGHVVLFAYPAVALALSTVGALGVNVVAASFERERVRETFARFVSDAVVEEVMAAGGVARLGGVRRESTLLFSDLRGFTAFAEALEPERVIEVLNRYLGEMSGAILDEGGTLVAYMGDGIMAVFGAPLASDDHADRALAAAREMLSRLEVFNAWLAEQGLGTGFKMGVGLNTGPVMSGHVGSERRLEYTAIGDTTNTAARLEAMTKGTPHQLYLSGATRAALHTPADDLVFVGDADVRGRRAAIAIWTLPGSGAAG